MLKNFCNHCTCGDHHYITHPREKATIMLGATTEHLMSIFLNILRYLSCNLFYRMYHNEQAFIICVRLHDRSDQSQRANALLGLFCNPCKGLGCLDVLHYEKLLYQVESGRSIAKQKGPSISAPVNNYACTHAADHIV